MRPSGNLAGVEFMDAPLYHRNREEWREIISESGYFFTKSAQRWFGSRVNWDSLTGITQELYGFITSEQDSSGGAWDGERRYTVRGWTKELGIVDLSKCGEFDNLKQAKHYLANNGFGDYEIVKELRAKSEAEFEAWRAANAK